MDFDVDFDFALPSVPVAILPFAWTSPSPAILPFPFACHLALRLPGLRLYAGRLDSACLDVDFAVDVEAVAIRDFAIVDFAYMPVACLDGGVDGSRSPVSRFK